MCLMYIIVNINQKIARVISLRNDQTFSIAVKYLLNQMTLMLVKHTYIHINVRHAPAMFIDQLPQLDWNHG